VAHVSRLGALGALFTWENDGPDNSWLCSDASLSLSYIGDPSALYPEIKANVGASGWTELGGAYVSDADFAVFQKDVAGGVRLNAIVCKQPLWAEVDLNAPGLHPGENGF
jgi:hypothetical protein